MKTPRLSLIAAMTKERGIGKGNALPWHIPEDMKHFRTVTSGHAVIMGRKTFESIGKPLPDRTNIVVTRDASYTAQGCTIVHSLEEAIEKAKEVEKDEVFVIGGGQMYAEALPFADTLYLTFVDGSYDTDTSFPDFTQSFHLVHEVRLPEKGISFCMFERNV